MYHFVIICKAFKGAQVHMYSTVGLISDGIFNLVQSSKNEPNHCPQLFNLE